MKLKKLSIVFILVSILVATSDLLLVYISYKNSKQSLQYGLEQKTFQLQNTYQLTLAQVGGFMRQTAAYIANDERVNQLFLEGSRAVAAEGGGAGGIEAQRIRKELYQLVSSGWNEMTKNYKGRQLHFHLPIAVSFLRVHRPDKFGDDLSDIRHSIVAANTTLENTIGFESGRVYAGVRGVVPVFSKDPETGYKIHIGALEAGTSFALMLQQLKETLSADFAVLMTMEHTRNTMWPEFIKEYSITHPIINNHLLEGFTNKTQVKLLMENISVQQLLNKEKTILTKISGQYFGVGVFPLRNYLGTVDSGRKSIGSVLVWFSAENEVQDFDEGLINTILVAIIGFIVVELLIYFGLIFEHKLIKQSQMAMTDGLTDIPNRHYFDVMFKQELLQAKRNNQSLSLILCDIDYFKQYNDHYGHIMGDKALQLVARTIKLQLKRKIDFVARYGGEEFVIVLSAANKTSSIKIAKAIQNAVYELKIEHQTRLDNETRITISSGIICYTPASETVIPEKVINMADKALYQAKFNGRNQIVYYNDII